MTESKPHWLNAFVASVSLHSLILFTLTINIIAAFLLRFAAAAMYVFFVVFFLWSASYIFLLALILYDAKTNGPQRIPLILLILITILPRALLLFTSTLISLDTLWYLDFGKFMLQGKMPYADFYFPYPPVFGYFILIISLIAPTVDSFRILSTVFDVLIVCLLDQMAKQVHERPELSTLPLAYALFPVTIIEAGLNGHFEPIANLFLLLSIWFLLNGKSDRSALFLGLSAATKIYAAFILPVVIFLVPSWKNRMRYSLISLATFFLTFIPFSIPVWLRGDMLPPGAAMPELSSGGFFDSVFGYLTRLSPFHQITVIAIGTALITALGVFFYRRSKSDGPSQRPVTYDVLVFALAVVFIAMALIAAVYPFTPAAIYVYWRYPGDIALIRGFCAIITSMVLLHVLRRRWRMRLTRKVTLQHKILLLSTGILLLLSISRNVFYGWYLLWAIPPLLFMKDRRILFTIIVCMLLIYPSYTHDNFVNLGYSEEKTWVDDFVGVDAWSVSVNLPSGVSPSNINATISSNHGIGEFFVDARAVQNTTALRYVSIIWSRDVHFTVTSLTEFVDLVSASWDPTFGRLGEFGVFFEGINETRDPVYGMINSPSWSPTNLSWVFWRFAFASLPRLNQTVEVTRLFVVASALTPNRMTFYIDIMYTTEYHVITPVSVLTMVLLIFPNMVALVALNLVLNDSNDDTLLSDRPLEDSSSHE